MVVGRGLTVGRALPAPFAARFISFKLLAKSRALRGFGVLRVHLNILLFGLPHEFVVM